MDIPYNGQTILTTPMGPGFFIFFNEIFYDGPRGGMQKHFEVLPRRIYLKKEAGEPLLRWKDIIAPKEEVEIISEEGEAYLIIEGPPPTPKQALKLLPKHELKEKIEEVKVELKVLKGEAIKILEGIVEKELKKAEVVKLKLIEDDELLALIIIMSEA